jgi:hypothetical protein
MLEFLKNLTMHQTLSALLHSTPTRMDVDQETSCPSIKINHQLFKQHPKKRRVRFDLSAADHPKCVLQKRYKTHEEKENKNPNLLPRSATPGSASTHPQCD